MTSRRLVTAAAVLAAVGWIGWSSRASWRSADRLEERLSRMETALEHPAPSAAAAAGERRQFETAVALQLRTAHDGAEALDRIQARLDTLAASVATPSVGTSSVTTPPPPTAEQLGAASAARALIARGVEQGRWTDESRHQMSRFLNQMDHDARDELARALVSAVNAGKLTVDGPIL